MVHLWIKHKEKKGIDVLHTPGLFGKHRPLAYASKISAELTARNTGGRAAKAPSGLWHVHRNRPEWVKEEADPKLSLSTVKRVLKTKTK